jgi:PAS domain-containing protein
MVSIRPQAPAVLTRHWIARAGDAPDGDAPPAVAHGWQCELATEALTWSGGVFELFGIVPGTRIDRREILEFYDEQSRAILERVRAEAVARCGSFTLEARICRLDGAPRWMRITADVAAGSDARPRLLYGTKQDVSDEIAAGRAPFLGPLAG